MRPHECYSCGDYFESIYYLDRTNDVALCCDCHGKPVPEAHKERRMEKTSEALAPYEAPPNLAPTHAEALTVTGAARTIAAQAKAVLTALRVVDAQTMETASGYIRQVRQITKALEAERSEKTKLLRDYLEQMRSWWRQPLKDYGAAMEHLRKEVNAFEARRKAELAASLTQAKTQEELQRSVEALAVTPEGMHFREEWSVKVVDKMKVPFEFWRVDEDALLAKVRTEKGDFSVPGCEAVCERKAVVR